jgi:hypothetical protein
MAGLPAASMASLTAAAPFGTAISRTFSPGTLTLESKWRLAMRANVSVV